MTAAEIREWQAFWRLEPFGDDWRRTARLQALMAEINRNERNRSEPFTEDDFMPRWPEDEEETEFAEEVMETAEPTGAGDEPWKAWKKAFQLLAENSAGGQDGNT